MSSIKSKLKTECFDYILKCNSEELGLMLGQSGKLFFLSNLIDQRFTNLITDQLIILSENSKNFNGFRFSGGIGGYLFLLNHLINKNIISYDLIDYKAYKDVVCFGLDKYIEEGNFDYLHGYLGLHNALLFNSTGSKDVYNRIFSPLLMFLSKPNEFPKDDNLNPSFLANFGLAHGIPSFLAVLINHSKSLKKDTYVKIIKQLTDFIFSFRNPNNGNTLYPNMIPSDSNSLSYKSRLAWCYGDVGVGLALLKASIYLKDKSLEKKVLEDLIITTYRRNVIDTGVIDCSFCHGAAGLIYYYKRLFSKFKISEFYDAYIFWENFIIDRYKNNGLSGLSTHSKKNGWNLELGLLEGICGIYFSIFNDEFSSEEFDYLFLTNLP